MSRFQLSGHLVKRLAGGLRHQLCRPKTETDQKPSRRATSDFGRAPGAADLCGDLGRRYCCLRCAERVIWIASLAIRITIDIGTSSAPVVPWVVNPAQTDRRWPRGRTLA